MSHDEKPVLKPKVSKGYTRRLPVTARTEEGESLIHLNDEGILARGEGDYDYALPEGHAALFWTLDDDGLTIETERPFNELVLDDLDRIVILELQYNLDTADVTVVREEGGFEVTIYHFPTY